MEVYHTVYIVVYVARSNQYASVENHKMEYYIRTVRLFYITW